MEVGGRTNHYWLVKGAGCMATLAVLNLQEVRVDDFELCHAGRVHGRGGPVLMFGSMTLNSVTQGACMAEEGLGRQEVFWRRGLHPSGQKWR